MVFCRFVIIVAVLFYAPLANGAELPRLIEEKILEQDWQGVSQLTKTRHSTEERNVTDAANKVVRFLKYCDTLDNLPDNQALSFKKIITNTYANIPQKLPFSEKLVTEVNDRKNKALERLEKIAESDRKKEKKQNINVKRSD